MGTGGDGVQEEKRGGNRRKGGQGEGQTEASDFLPHPLMRYAVYDLLDVREAVYLEFLYAFVCHQAWPQREVHRQLVKAVTLVHCIGSWG